MDALRATIVVLLAIFASIESKCIWEPSQASQLVIVDREGWGARPPTSKEEMTNPVPYVVIHHSYIPGACSTNETCEKAMRSMQDFHMDDRGWADVGYSFAVGGDGRAYIGRGWSSVGAHAPGYNDRSIGICNIGDFVSQVPPKHQFDTVKALIAEGVKLGFIDENYKLIGHRQARPTECPGQALFDEITTWPHYSPDEKPPKKQFPNK